MLNKYKNILLTIIATIFVCGGVVLAGELLNNDSVPSSTAITYTLEDIYQKVSSSTYSNSAHTLSPLVSTSENSMHSLGDIYGSIPAYQTIDGSTTTLSAGIYATTTLSEIDTDLVQSNIASGTTMFGIIGTFECTAP